MEANPIHTVNGAPLARRFACGLLFALTLSSCGDGTRAPPVSTSASPAELSAEEQKLIAHLAFDAELMRRVKDAGTGFDQLRIEDPMLGIRTIDGLALMTKPEGAEVALDRVRAQLAGSTYGAWINDKSFGTGPDQIALLKTRDQFAFLAIARTDGINFDLDHAKVAARYREWAAQYGLELRGAGVDWLEANITKPPANWLAFATEVYAFCPDIVEQGTGTVAALAADMEERKVLYLWWD
jgi:hypothetical protein